MRTQTTSRNSMPTSQNLDFGIFWISGYLDIWIFGYLDIWILLTSNLLFIPTLSFSVVQPCRGFFVTRKKNIPGVLQPKAVFLEFYLNNV